MLKFNKIIVFETINRDGAHILILAVPWEQHAQVDQIVDLLRATVCPPGEVLNHRVVPIFPVVLNPTRMRLENLEESNG